MLFAQSFIILLVITANIILIADRIKAKKTILGCKGKLLERNTAGPRNFEKIYHDLKNIKIPERFDAREEWPFCKSLFKIKRQGKCGGCWAFASSSVMSDRLCIATRGKRKRMLSEQDLLECCTYCVSNDEEDIGGCEGGYVQDAYKYWEEFGLVTGARGCKPTEESIVKGIPQKECRLRCTNESYKVEYKDDKTFSIKSLKTQPAEKTDIPHIMAEIMLNGPVGGGMKTYDYIHNVPPGTILEFNESLVKSGKAGQGHAIKILGWDNIGGTPVWIIANSWGTDWCDKGFCYVKRGNNDFEIEVRYYAGIPRIKKPKKKQKQIEKTQSSSFNIIKVTNPIEVAAILCILIM